MDGQRTHASDPREIASQLLWQARRDCRYGQNVTGARAAGVTLEQQAAACIRRLQATCDHLREKLRAVREQGVSETPRTQEAGGTSHASQATAKECKSDLQSKDA